MGTYNVHAGHCPQGQGASGAVGILQESVEDRKVKDRVIWRLREQGNTVYDCTVDYKTTKNGCLDGIIAACNSHAVDLDVSIHLNSGRDDYAGDGSIGGVEVLIYDNGTAEIAKSIADEIAKLGYRLREEGGSPYPGVKLRPELRVLNSTKAPAVLVECAFVDDMDDAKIWNADKIGDAIVKGMTGKVSENTNTGLDNEYIDNIHYAVGTVCRDGMLPTVTNWEDWAGIYGEAIDRFTAYCDNTPICYRGWIGSGWSDWVYSGGILGTKGVPIQRIQISAAGKFVTYNAHLCGRKESEWQGFISGYKENDKDTGGFRGWTGMAMDGLICVVKYPRNK